MPTRRGPLVNNLSILPPLLHIPTNASPLNMPHATYLGPCVSPGDLFFQKEIEREGLDGLASVGQPRNPSSLLQSIRSIFPGVKKDAVVDKVVSELNDYSTTSAVDARRGTSVNEELAWYRDKVVWSKGNIVFRTFSYEAEKEHVVMALFAWFDVAAATGTPRSEDIQKAEIDDVSIPSGSTFGPFSTSQMATWSDPRRMRKDNRSIPPSLPRRCLVVFLQTQAHIYLPSGKVEVVTFPFSVDHVWPLKSGGLVIQRALTRNERQSVGRGREGLRVSGDGTLDQVMGTTAEPTMGEGSRARLTTARMFYLRHPASEVMVLGRTTRGSRGRRGEDRPVTTPIFTLPVSSETVWVSSDHHPLLVTLDHDTGQLVFYRWTRLSSPAVVSIGVDDPPPTHRTPPAGATDLFTARPPQRPSLGRQRSSYAAGGGDRRKSGLGRSPAAQTRRVSSHHHQDPHPAGPMEVITSSNALRAALDTNTNIPHAGSSSHVRADVDPPGMTSRAGPAAGGAARRVSRNGPRDVENGRILLNHANETDVRETTMLMGLEENEEGMVTEMVLEEFHRWDLDGLRWVCSAAVGVSAS